MLHKMHSLSAVLFTKWSFYGSFFGTFANVIMTEIKRKIVKSLTAYGLLKLYIGYLNDTFLLAKLKRYLKLTRFIRNINITSTSTAIHHGITKQLVKHLYRCARKICSSKETFAFQINKIFISWNGYPTYVHNSIIKRLKQIEAATGRSNNKYDEQKIILVELIW